MSFRIGRVVTIFGLVSAAAGISTGALIACSSGPTILPVKEPDKCTLQIVGVSVIASPRINPSELGCPRPVQLRIYQLKTETRMLNAAFEDIWKKDKETLGEDLVKVEETTVYPDSRQEIKFERDPAALYIAAVALYRTPKGKSWWTSFELPPAPGKGDCGMPKCTGEGCEGDAGKEPPNLTPKFAIYLDEMRVADGEDHLEEYPDGGRLHDFYKQCTPTAPPAPIAPPPPQGGKGLR